MTPLVQLHQIDKRFPGVLALRGVDLTLLPGRIHALVGENGAGKSTLLNILAGLLQPDAGEIRLKGQPLHLGDARDAWAAGIVTVHQEVDLFNDLSVAENTGWQQGLPSTWGWINWPEQRRRTIQALATVGSPVAPGESAGRLTPAQRQLVEIAGAISRSGGDDASPGALSPPSPPSPLVGDGARGGEGAVLVLDEPTSSLSAGESTQLFEHLRRFRSQGTAIVYVSHRFEEIFALADDITVLRDGQCVWTGPVSDTTPDQLIRHMVGRPVDLARRNKQRVSGPVRLGCTNLTDREGLFHDVTLDVKGGEVLGLYGLIGAGRSEWAQAIFGLRPVASGEVRIADRRVRPTGPGQMARCGVAYVPEDRLRQGLCRGLGVRLNSVLAALRPLSTLGWLPQGRENASARRIVEQLRIRCASLEQTAGTLSGGNQQKVVVGRWLQRDPAVLILDEPTRGVDVAAREEIYQIVHRLADEGRAVVLISSDLPEVITQSDRIGVFRSGRLVALLAAGESTAETVAALALPDATPRSKSVRGSSLSLHSLLRRLHPHALGLFVVVFFLVLHLLTGRFLQADSLASRANDAALLAIAATGAMLVLLVGGLDISLGALMALSAGVAGHLWERGLPFPLVLLAALAIGATGGTINAGLSLVGRVHPIVVTLGMMSVYRGLTHWCLGQDVQIPLEQRGWALSAWLGVPLLVWLGLALGGVAWLWLNFHTSGRELYALGSNPRAAHRVGIHPARVWLLAFGLEGLLAGLAGLLYLARAGSMQPTSHEDRTLQAIAAAVVGGVAITGGRGSVVGVAIGCLLLVSLGPACIFLGVSPYWEQTLVGGILLAAVLLDALSRRRR